MIDKLKKIYGNSQKWGNSHLFRMFIFNTILVFLVLMRSAGYFIPYFEISINFIVFFMLLLSIFLLGAKSKSIFFVSLTFWIFAAAMKMLGVDIWAERTAIYTFESLLIGTILLTFEVNAYAKKHEK